MAEIVSILALHHDDIIKWKHIPRNWPFVWRIHRSPVNSPHKSQWRGTLMFSLIHAWTNVWINNRDAGGLRRYCGHYDVIEMILHLFQGVTDTSMFVQWGLIKRLLRNIKVYPWSPEWQFLMALGQFIITYLITRSRKISEQRCLHSK